MNRAIPFRVLDIVILHHIPFKPKAVPASNSASGILAEVRIIPTTEGGIVLPKPENAPAVAISIHINNCEYPKILK